MDLDPLDDDFDDEPEYKKSSITSVTLRRGPCYGPCPVYEVTLRAAGKALWKGREFTPRLGEYTAKLAYSELEDFHRIGRFIERCGFFYWNDAYTTEVTDHPGYDLTVRRGRRVKKVYQYATDEPPDFWVIAQLVDALAERIHWSADDTATQPQSTASLPDAP